MNYQNPYGGYYGNGGYGSAPQYPVQRGAPQYGNSTSNFDPVALQMRIVQAKQVNLMYKQNIARNLILNSNTLGGQSRVEAPSHQEQYASPYSQQPRPLYSHEEPLQSNNYASVPLLERDKRRGSHYPAAIPNTQPPPSNNEPVDPRTSNVTRNSQNNASQGAFAEPKPGSRAALQKPTSIGDEEDHSVPYEEHATSAAPQRPRDDVHLLSSLAENMAKTVDDNTHDLKKLTAAKKTEPGVEKEKTKKKLEQLIKVNANNPAVMPLWRHKLEGRLDPPAELILKGVRLFRVIARSILYLIVKPTVTRIKRIIVVRERERKELQKTLNIAAGGLGDWIGKIVQLPVSSIAQDNTLNFEPVESFVSNAQPLRARMLQLKVRLRGAIMNIAKSELPSDYITDLLVAFVEEGNYFTAGLLWDCEISRMDFTSLGATHDVAPQLSAEQLSQGSYGASDIVRLPIKEATETEGASRATTATAAAAAEVVVLCAMRARMLILNFVFIRVLVNHIILSPWNHDLCGEPSRRSLKRTIYNHRLFATSVYELVRSLDPMLPVIGSLGTANLAQITSSKEVSTSNKEEGKFIIKASNVQSRVIGAALVEAANNSHKSTAADTALPGPHNVSAPPRSPLAGISTRFGLGITSARLSAPATHSPAALATTSQPATAQTGAVAEVPTPAAQSSLLLKLSKLMGMSDTTPGMDIVSKGSIESFLLAPRPEEYSSLQALHMLLVPPTQLGPLRGLLDEWFKELTGPLTDWLDRLVKHVLKRRMQQRTARDKGTKL